MTVLAIGVGVAAGLIWWVISLSHLATIANGVQRLAVEAEKQRPRPEPQQGPQWPARFDQ